MAAVEKRKIAEEDVKTDTVGHIPFINCAVCRHGHAHEIRTRVMPQIPSIEPGIVNRIHRIEIHHIRHPLNQAQQATSPHLR